MAPTVRSANARLTIKKLNDVRRFLFGLMRTAKQTSRFPGVVIKEKPAEMAAVEKDNTFGATTPVQFGWSADMTKYG